jgi:hypothetical protein
MSRKKDLKRIKKLVPFKWKQKLPGKNEPCPCGCGKKAKDHILSQVQDEMTKRIIEKRSKKKIVK